jgi:serine/threonine protein kinase
VVPIYDVGEIDDRLYVTMRLINGVDLQTLIDEGPLERDVKPSNILVDKNDYAYLIDFGSARAATDTRLTSASSAIGTWAYMAPERFNSGEVHSSSDVYALACVLYQCLTGQQPFPGTTLEQVAVGHMVTPPPRPSERAAIPRELDRVIATGLAKQPAERYPTTVDMAQPAKEAVTGSASSSAWSARPPRRPEALPRRAGRSSRSPRSATRLRRTRRRRPHRRRAATTACSSAPWCSSRHW